jgi:uncharacterized protein HemX
MFSDEKTKSSFPIPDEYRKLLSVAVTVAIASIGVVHYLISQQILLTLEAAQKHNDIQFKAMQKHYDAQFEEIQKQFQKTKTQNEKQFEETHKVLVEVLKSNERIAKLEK